MFYKLDQALRKVLITALAVTGLLSCNDNGSGITPSRGTVTESVYAAGVVRAERQYTAFAPVSGTLLKINAVAGRGVGRGEVLFEIENRKERLMSENALQSYRHSREGGQYAGDRIREMESLVRSSAVKADADCSYYDRCSRAMRYGGVTAAELERASAACRGSRLGYEVLQKQLSQLREELKNEQSLNRISLQLSRSSEDDYLVRSALDGMVYDVTVHEGTLITPQTPLAVLGAKGAYYIALEVDENDMARVTVGQRIMVTLDSYKGKLFEAVVDAIYPIVDEHTRTFKVEAHFVKAPRLLYPNLPVEASIIIRRKPDALLIPREYLVGDRYVLTGKGRKRKVTTGISDYRQVEVTSGLRPGETIYKPQ